MFTLVVAPLKHTMFTVDGVRMRVYPILVKEAEEYGFLRERVTFSDVSNAHDVELSLFLYFWRIKFRLTPKIKKGMAEFLCNYHAKQNIDFDCYAFVNQVYGIQAHDKSLLRNFWHLHPRRWRTRIGDVIFLVTRQEKRFHHAAIYIGFGLYLSVYGAGGDLEIATLKDMKRDYGAKEVLLARAISD